MREACRLAPTVWVHWSNLGLALIQARHIEEGLDVSLKALAMAPEQAVAHYNHGNALGAAGRNDDAIEAYEEAIRLDPSHAEAHCNLASRYHLLGRFGEALEAMRRGHELGSKRPDWPYPSAQWLENAERMAPMEERLPAILDGSEKIDALPDLALVAEIAYQRELYGASARLRKQLLDSAPAAASNLAAFVRFNAACSAARVGTGQGKDAATLNEAARATWRRQALDWLKADLVAWQSLALPTQLGPYLGQCLADVDLAALREEAGLAKLPQEERDAWESYWADVRAALVRAKGGR